MAKALVPRESNVTDVTIQKHIRALTQLKTTADEASGQYRAAVKAAKSDGVNTTELLAVLQAKKRDAEDVMLGLKARVRYLALVNMPVHQADLFDAGIAVAGTRDPGEEPAEEENEEHVAWEARESGKAAGLAGEPKENNRFQLGSFRHQAWHSGWLEGQQQLSKGQNGVKKASTRRTRAPAHAH